MADKNLFTKKYPVVELTGITSLGVEEIYGYAKKDAAIPALMNGMLVDCDTVRDLVKLPAGADAEVWLHASVEKMYDGLGMQRSEFAVTDSEGFLPRCYRLKKGQSFETNACISGEWAKIEDIRAVLAAGTKVYGIPDVTGLIRLTATAPADTVVNHLEVKQVVILPNGEYGVELVVQKAV